MKSNGIDNGTVTGLVESSPFVGLASGMLNNEQMISDTNTFIFTVKTNAAVAATRTVQLPLAGTGVYNFWVDWGDGRKDYVTSLTQIYPGETVARTHTYRVAGTYTIKITGVCRGWIYSSYTNEQPKLLSIERFGCLELLEELGGGQQFSSCTNLDLSNVKDTLSTKFLTSTTGLFGSCTTINKISLINNWSVGNITSFNTMFANSNFNSEISNWNMSNATNFNSMFQSCDNFNQYIGNWDTSNVTSMANMFPNCIFFNQDISSWNTANVIAMNNMLQGASSFNQPIGSWDVSKVINISNMFASALAFNQQIGSWNVGLVTNMNSMFQGATAFNQPLNSWNVSNVITMSNMFRDASSFNQNIGSWNMSSVTNIPAMFAGATAFNQPLDSWNVSNVTNMGGLFLDATSFNQPIGSWDTSKVTNITQMFNNATAFNQDISNWNVGLVTSMYNTFKNATNFNQNISSWNTSNVNNMFEMFMFAPNFNQPIGSWNTSKVTDMSRMFQNANLFNQNIGNWNVGLVTDFTNFMSTKTIGTFSTTNLDAIYNGWINNLLLASRTISFGSAKRTSASTEGRLLLSRANVSLTVSGVVDNGSGLIRVTTSTAHGMVTGNKIFISAVTGAIQANGLWTVTVISTTQVDLQGSAFSSAYISGGAFRTGYGWTIVDGGI